MATAQVQHAAPQLRRSDDAVVAGICSGLAAFFGVDAVVVRILGILLLFVSFGWLALVYVILWLVIPPALPQDAPIDITVDETPRGASALPSNMAPGKVIGLVLAGITIVSVGMAAVMDALIVNASWWQFWPVLVFALGVLMMVLPTPKPWRADTLAAGIALLGIGALCLLCSIGLISWRTVAEAATHMWGLGVLAVCLSVFGHLRKSGAIVFGAGVVILASCVLAMVLYSTPGGLESLVLKAPIIGDHEFVMRIWQG